MIKKHDEEKQEEPEQDDALFFPEMPSEALPRTIGVYGEINESQAKTTIGALYLLSHVEEEEPIDFVVSTEGGNVQDMFSIYDCIRDISKILEIKTFGVGKVMSAGVLLLAAGTKGKRRVGRHCRLMLHPVSGGHFGSIKELETDIREVRWYQEQFMKAIIAETKLDLREIKKIFRKGSDTYFDADQAIEWGIADEVV